jgi:glycosyltransferase involved in cell wall biosynthesis
MYRVRLHYDVPQWAYHRRVAALAKHAPNDFQVETGAWHPLVSKDAWPTKGRYDLVMQLVPDHANLRKLLAERKQEDTVIVGGLNVGYGHHEERLKMCRTGADHIVVNNRDCWERLGRPKGTSWISNGVDLDTFVCKTPPAGRLPRVLWTGCEFHCKGPKNRGTNIKGWDEVLIPLADKLQHNGIRHDYRRVKSERPDQCFSTANMVDWYNTGTVYICTSSSEGTPNTALEAAACGCVVVSTRVGNMPELITPYVNGELVDRNVDALFEAILRCQAQYPEMAAEMQGRIADWDWRHAASKYYNLFRRLIDARRAA